MAKKIPEWEDISPRMRRVVIERLQEEVTNCDDTPLPVYQDMAAAFKAAIKRLKIAT